MMPSTVLHKWFCSAEKGAARPLDKEISENDISLTAGQNYSTEMFLMMPSTKNDQIV